MKGRDGSLELFERRILGLDDQHRLGVLFNLALPRVSVKVMQKIAINSCSFWRRFNWSLFSHILASLSKNETAHDSHGCELWHHIDTGGQVSLNDAPKTTLYHIKIDVNCRLHLYEIVAFQ
jgi:hypothetical protein